MKLLFSAFEVGTALATSISIEAPRKELRERDQDGRKNLKGLLDEDHLRLGSSSGNDVSRSRSLRSRCRY